MNLFRYWMAFLALIWLVATVMAVVKGELLWAIATALISLGLLDAFRRDQRAGERDRSKHGSEVQNSSL